MNTVPEMLRCNLSGVILNLKAMGIKDVFKMDFVDKPSMQSYLKAFDILIKLKAIDPETGNLTVEGNKMSVLPTEPLYSKLLVTSLKPDYKFIRHDICIIVSMLSVDNIMVNSSVFFGSEKQIMVNRKKLMVPQSDHLSMLRILKSFEYTLKKEGTNRAKQFCIQFGFNDKSLSQALLIKKQLMEYMTKLVQNEEKG